MQSEQSQELEQSFDEQPTNMLNLFRKRVPRFHELSLQVYKKLYQTLCCSICLGLFNNPVYLRCSHRFCKNCLEEYIRKSEKKSCPNCRDSLSTRRDLHIDYSLTSIIRYGFGDIKQFNNRLQKIDQKLVKTISSEYKEMKNQQRIIQYENGNETQKKVKLNQTFEKGDQKPDKNNSIKNQILKFVESEPKESKKIQIQKTLTKRQSSKNQGRSATKKQKASSVNLIQQKPISAPIIPSGIYTPNNPTTQSTQAIHQQSSPIKMSDSDQETPSLREAKQFLMNQLGQNYIKTIIQLSSARCAVVIRFLRLTDHIPTPELPFSSFKVGLDTQILDIKQYISYCLNFEQIRLFIGVENGLIQIPNQKMTILQVNQKYWKSYKNMEIFDMKDLERWLQSKDANQEAQTTSRIFFYAADYYK